MSDTPQDHDKTVLLGGAGAEPAAPAPAAAAAHDSHNALPPGTHLGEFEIIGLVGEGGFGIVYMAQDHSLGRRVALKEYMPASLAARKGDTSVAVRSERHRETFEIGRRSFVNEARLLAQFDHNALVKVYRFWEANGTAYMVMPLYEGKTLRDVLAARATPPDELWIRRIIAPVMEALEIIHNESCFHRDIAPDNIMLLRDERPVLLDFGAARRVIGDMTQALTVILKPGYAPIEQYAEMPGMKQGPWTDIYALAAVVYHMIVGKTPPPAVGRMLQDSFEPLSVLVAGQYSAGFLHAIDTALAVKAEDRPQSIAALRELLGWTQPLAPTTIGAVPPPPPAARAASGGGPRATAASPAAPPNPAAAAPGRALPWLAGVALGGAVLGAAAYWWQQRPVPPQPLPEPVPQSVPAAASAALALPSPPPPAATPHPPLPLSEAWRVLPDIALAEWAPRLAQIKSPLVVNQDALSVSLHSAQQGYLYLLLWDQASGQLKLVFPNGLDRDNAIAPGKPVVLPRKDWAYKADEPAGEWALMAIVAATPRDFSRLGFSREDSLPSVELATVEAALGVSGAQGLAGQARCAEAANCPPQFGVASFSVSTVQKSAVLAPNGRAASATPKPLPREASDVDSERRYMKKLNEDLDKLLEAK